MMYTRERLMKAVREAGQSGQPFTLGEVRAALGLKSQDKRELKRFRSRFRDCCISFGDGIEKLGPNTFRLRGVQLTAAQVAVLKPIKSAQQGAAIKQATHVQHATRVARIPSLQSESSKPRVPPPPSPQAPNKLSDRVAVAARNDEEDDPYTTKRRPREAISYVAAEPGSAPARNVSFGERISSWFGRSSRPASNTSAAATALSRLAVDLQPKAANFEYRWIDGKLQVQRAADK